MKKLAAQQVQQEKDEGQKRLEEALKKARDEFFLEKAEAIQKTREEECAMATDEAKKVAQVEEDKRKQLILAAEKEKQVELPSIVHLKGIKIMWLSLSDKEFSIPPGPLKVTHHSLYSPPHPSSPSIFPSSPVNQVLQMVNPKIFLFSSPLHLLNIVLPPSPTPSLQNVLKSNAVIFFSLAFHLSKL